MGEIKIVNFKIALCNHVSRFITQKCVRHIMKEKFLFAERFIRTFIRTLKNKIHKYMTSISKKCTLMN